jgi:hypothetical protein
MYKKSQQATVVPMGYVYNVMDSTEKNCWESSLSPANMHLIQRILPQKIPGIRPWYLLATKLKGETAPLPTRLTISACTRLGEFFAWYGAKVVGMIVFRNE